MLHVEDRSRQILIVAHEAVEVFAMPERAGAAISRFMRLALNDFQLYDGRQRQALGLFNDDMRTGIDAPGDDAIAFAIEELVRIFDWLGDFRRDEEMLAKVRFDAVFRADGGNHDMLHDARTIAVPDVAT
ncbi:MAG: hypothetical protein R3C16_06155 [Hyphomonadaceae bacterium]